MSLKTSSFAFALLHGLLKLLALGHLLELKLQHTTTTITCPDARLLILLILLLPLLVSCSYNLFRVYTHDGMTSCKKLNGTAIHQRLYGTKVSKTRCKERPFAKFSRKFSISYLPKGCHYLQKRCQQQPHKVCKAKSSKYDNLPSLMTLI